MGVPGSPHLRRTSGVSRVCLRWPHRSEQRAGRDRWRPCGACAGWPCGALRCPRRTQGRALPPPRAAPDLAPPYRSPAGCGRASLELRTQVTAWVAKHRRRGESWSDLVRKTGVSMLSLQHWSAGPARRAVMLRRVEVAEAALVSPGLGGSAACSTGSLRLLIPLVCVCFVHRELGTGSAPHVWPVRRMRCASPDPWEPRAAIPGPPSAEGLRAVSPSARRPAIASRGGRPMAADRVTASACT
jgi:hypothetical protein